jgi:hypothetical protein
MGLARAIRCHSPDPLGSCAMTPGNLMDAVATASREPCDTGRRTPVAETRPMRRYLIIPLLALAFAACGGDETVSAEDADRIAAELAQETESVKDDVAEAADTLIEDPDAVDQARERLRDGAERARDLAAEAEDLPESVDARAQLREANDRIAEAAGDLAEADGDRQAVDAARRRLEEAGDRIAAAADRLADELPQDARDDLDALRERLSEEP